VDRGKFSPKLSLVFKPLAFGQNTDIEGVIRASYGEAFTAPSLYYRVTSYYWSGAGSISMANPNPDLEPETNRSWEVGTEWNLWKKRINLKATYFENYFENLIVNASKNSVLEDGTTLTEKKRINAEEAEVKGVELAAEASLPFDFRCGAFYAHNWSEYIKTYGDAKNGRELDETPTDMASGWLGYFGDYFEASITARYCDSRYDDEYAPYADKNYKGDDEYYIADAKISVKPYKHLKLSLAVDNLLDYEYYEYYRGPGRFWQGTVEVSF
jgi:iron complex outermembrane recepter protein